MSERRVPCTQCSAPIVVGARKCRACKAWQTDAIGARGKFPRAGVIMLSAVATVMSVLITSGESPVGEAPPLTALPDSPAGGTEPAPGAIIPTAEAEAKRAAPATSESKQWHSRQLLLGDFHPLDVAFHPTGESVYVSGDDATLREYRLSDGKLIHKASIPARGDRIELLYGRYVALLRNSPGVGRMPVMDTTRWDKDPVLLPVGAGPRAVAEMPDGESIATATSHGRRISRFALPSGRRLADITLPQSTGQLFSVDDGGRTYLAALGSQQDGGGRSEGAWIDLFDPTETPFGATRRSIPVGRSPGWGSVSEDGKAIFFPDLASNQAHFVDVERRSEQRSVSVGQKPIAAFVMAGGAFGVTLNETSQTASVIDLAEMRVVSTLMLNGTPRGGTLTPDRQTLLVSLGGGGFPARGSGVAVISGARPQVVATLPTGEGVGSVAITVDGEKAVVPNYFTNSITLFD